MSERPTAVTVHYIINVTEDVFESFALFWCLFFMRVYRTVLSSTHSAFGDTCGCRHPHGLLIQVKFRGQSKNLSTYVGKQLMLRYRSSIFLQHSNVCGAVVCVGLLCLFAVLICIFFVLVVSVPDFRYHNICKFIRLFLYSYTFDMFWHRCDSFNP